MDPNWEKWFEVFENESRGYPEYSNGKSHNRMNYKPHAC